MFFSYWFQVSVPSDGKKVLQESKQWIFFAFRFRSCKIQQCKKWSSRTIVNYHCRINSGSKQGEKKRCNFRTSDYSFLRLLHCSRLNVPCLLQSVDSLLHNMELSLLQFKYDAFKLNPILSSNNSIIIWWKYIWPICLFFKV